MKNKKRSKMLKFTQRPDLLSEYDGRCGIFFYWVSQDCVGRFFKKPTNKWGAYITIGTTTFDPTTTMILGEDSKYDTKEEAMKAVEDHIKNSIKEMCDVAGITNVIGL